MRLYLAGPLFTQAEREWNFRLARLLTEAGHTVFLPQEEVLKLDELSAEAAFRCDVEGVRSAEAVVAVLDGADPDSGSSFECGLAFALEIPIVLVRTDFRGGGDDLHGQKIGSINLMLSEAAARIVHKPDPAASLADVAASVLEALADLTS